jgi:hypothetical protein
VNWTITYRAVLHGALADDRAAALKTELAGFSTAHPGRQIQVPDASAGTLLAGEVAVCEEFGYPEVERLLARLSDLENLFPEITIQARDSLGLVGRDPTTQRLYVTLIGSDEIIALSMEEEYEDPFDLAVDAIFGEDAWPLDDLDNSPFAPSMWQSYDLGEPKRIAARSDSQDGIWTGELAIDVQHESGADGAVLLVSGQLSLDGRVDRAHVATCEVVVRSDTGELLGVFSSRYAHDAHRGFEVHMEVGLDRAELEEMTTVEVFVDSYARYKHVLARWTPPTELVSIEVPEITADFKLRHTDWPIPGLKVSGDLKSTSQSLITAVDIAFVARDQQGVILDDDEVELGHLMPGQQRPLNLQLTWDYDADTAVGGALHASVVLRERQCAWRGHIVRLSLVPPE